MAEAELPFDPDGQAEAAAWEDWLLLQADALEQELEQTFDISGAAVSEVLSGLLPTSGVSGADPLLDHLRAFLRGEIIELPELAQFAPPLEGAAELDPWEVQALLEAAEEDEQSDAARPGAADA